MDFHGQQLSLFPAEAPSSGQQVVVEVTESVKFVPARGAHNFKPDEEWGWEELRDYVVERAEHVRRQRLGLVLLQDLEHPLPRAVSQALAALGQPAVPVLPIQQRRIPVLPVVARGVRLAHEAAIRTDLVDDVQGQGLIVDLHTLHEALDPADEVVAHGQLLQGVGQAGVEIPHVVHQMRAAQRLGEQAEGCLSSGLLVGKLGGPPVKPYQPDGLWKEKANIDYIRDVGEGSHRRSLYTFWKRTSPPPAMLTFDATSREVCEVKRLPTATPLQALVLLNDPQYVEAALALAQRAAQEGGSTLADRASFIFRSLCGRKPSDRELQILQALYEEQYNEFRSGRSDAPKLLAIGDAPRDASIDPVECAALTVLAQTVMNHDEAVMKR